MEKEKQERIDELHNLIETKNKILENTKDDIKLELEKIKSFIRRQIFIEDEIREIEQKIKKLEEERVSNL